MMENTRAWVEIDLDAIRENAREIRRITAPGAQIMAVVKADAYGHGAVETAACVLEEGASRLAVSQLDEALQLRLGGIDAPILVLSGVEPERAAELIAYDVAQVVFTKELAEELSRTAVLLGKKARIHIKIDTGMGRIGFRAQDAQTVDEILAIAALPGLCIEGIFTHFAVSDETNPQADAYTRGQFAAFMQVCDALEARGLHIPLRHAANSAAILRFPEMHLDLVRAGIILYGLYPSEATQDCAAVRAPGVSLRPAMTFKARVTAVKTVPAGNFLSYGCTYETETESVIATVPVGYADGYARSLGNRSCILLHGRRVPVRGRVCMDQCLVDVTELLRDGIPVRPGDEAVLFGRQGDGAVTLTELAALENTIPYEIICVVGKRIPRKYVCGGQIVKVVNGLVR